MAQALTQPERGAQPESVRSDRQDHPISAPPPRILFVSQSSDEREVYAHVFRAMGYCTLLASTRSEACRMAGELVPSAVVIDVGEWEWHEGVGMIQTLKADRRFRRVPMVILTGRSLTGDREVAARAGCDLFVCRPCLPDALVHVVNGIVGDRRTHDQARASGDIAEAS